jgi:ABC-type sugar transport system substrate-binding protein
MLTMKSSLGAVAAVAALLVLSGCANPENNGGGGSGATGGGQQTASNSSGPTCTLDAYGATKVDFSKAVIGFSQSEAEANPFRITETQSITDEAQKQGVQLLKRNANSNLSQQISDIQGLLAQGANLLVVAPLNSEGLEPALQAARDKKVPVVTIDRKLSSATPCKDYLTFIGSDFVAQGKRAATQLVKATNGTAKVAILLGATGNNVTTDRTSGFTDYLKANAPNVQVVAQQTGDFTREKGQSVTEQLLQAHPDITAVYAENDEMALGAVTAINGAGKKPGTDIKVFSVDGTRNVVQGIVNGQINGDVESNPRFGPLALSTLKDFLDGKAIPQTITIQDKEYDSANAAAQVGNSY